MKIPRSAAFAAEADLMNASQYLDSTSLVLFTAKEISTGTTHTGNIIDCRKFLNKSMQFSIDFTGGAHGTTGITVTTYASHTSVGLWSKLNHWSGLVTGIYSLALLGSGTYASGIEYYNYLKVLAQQEGTIDGNTGTIKAWIMTTTMG